eukprot:5331046-Heterocapsa_arctica.AAC.1
MLFLSGSERGLEFLSFSYIGINIVGRGGLRRRESIPGSVERLWGRSVSKGSLFLVSVMLVRVDSLVPVLVGDGDVFLLRKLGEMIVSRSVVLSWSVSGAISQVESEGVGFACRDVQPTSSQG